MFFRIIIAVLLTASVTVGKEAGTKRITTGDPLSKVRKLYGTPDLEYPLNGTLVQEYSHCTVISQKGLVISADYKDAAEADDEPVDEESPPTIDDIRSMANQGDAEAQYLLAFCFQFGKALDQDYNAAVTWYTKAAMQGHMPSQHNLGYMYMTGRGVEKDYEQAYIWALLAAENGNDTMKQAIIHRLSPEQKMAGEMGAAEMQFRMKAQSADEKQQEKKRRQ